VKCYIDNSMHLRSYIRNANSGQGNPTRGVLTLRNKWLDLPQCMKHRASKEDISLVFSFVFTFLPFFSLPFYKHEEVDEKVTVDKREDVGVHKSP
jgi:hypothetical protein